MCVRGLKRSERAGHGFCRRSHPVWVRSFRGIGYEVRPRLFNDILYIIFRCPAVSDFKRLTGMACKDNMQHIRNLAEVFLPR